MKRMSRQERPVSGVINKQVALLFAFALFGCVSIQQKNPQNRFFMPYGEKTANQVKPYNCLFVKGILGDKSKVKIFIVPKKNDPPFLIFHPDVPLEKNDLYRLTKNQASHIPFKVCISDSTIKRPHDKNVVAYNMSFLDAWALDEANNKVRLTDTRFWQRLKHDNDIDETQVYLMIEDEPDMFLDKLRYIFTLSLGSKDTTKQIHLRFRPRFETLREGGPRCNCEP